MKRRLRVSACLAVLSCLTLISIEAQTPEGKQAFRHPINNNNIGSPNIVAGRVPVSKIL